METYWEMLGWQPTCLVISFIKTITQHNTVLTIFSGKNVKHHPGTGDEAQE